MQISIYKVFGTIKSLYLLMFLLSALLTATIISEYVSFYKLSNLKNEKEIAAAVYNLSREDLDLANIQYRGKNTMLRHESNILSTYYAYDYLNKYTKNGSYTQEIAKLQQAIDAFNAAAKEWFAQETISDQELQSRKKRFTNSYNALTAQIDVMTAQNSVYEENRFFVQMGLAILLFLLILFSIVTIPLKLNKIRRDIKILNKMEPDEGATFKTVEGDTISKLMGRTMKSPTAINPAYLDSVSGINNLKGFMHEYSEKKNQKLGNYTAVCIFAIDKLTDLEMQYSQDFTEAIVKKVGFMLSLYRQHNDIIGHLDHNQFAIILSRQDKTSAINDCELVRKSVEETPFKNIDGSTVKVTLSGGFVQKMSTQNLDEVVAKANKVLSMSIQHGGNRIAQLRDKSTALK